VPDEDLLFGSRLPRSIGELGLHREAFAEAMHDRSSGPGGLSGEVTLERTRVGDVPCLRITARVEVGKF
jgi:hypothetical protein